MMRQIRMILGTIAAIALTAALIGLGAGNAPAAGQPADRATASSSAKSTQTTKEHGYVIECNGSYKGEDVWVSVYENNVFANVFQVVVGDNGTGASRESEAGFVDGRDVRAKLRLKGKKLVVAGTAARFGRRIPVHAEHDDAGQHIVEDGYHRQVRTDLSMTWKGTTLGLFCDNAFFYKLTVTKTDTAS